MLRVEAGFKQGRFHLIQVSLYDNVMMIRLQMTRKFHLVQVPYDNMMIRFHMTKS